MNKPHIFCYMMTSTDGRIDCAMTSKLSGRITAQLELALPAEYIAKDIAKEDHDCFSKKLIQMDMT